MAAGRASLAQEMPVRPAYEKRDGPHF